MNEQSTMMNTYENVLVKPTTLHVNENEDMTVPKYDWERSQCR